MFSPHTAANVVRQRELGLKCSLGHLDKLHRKIYSSLYPFGYWDYASSAEFKTGNSASGGVFNLEYSPDGYLF